MYSTYPYRYNSQHISEILIFGFAPEGQWQVYSSHFKHSFTTAIQQQ